MTLTGNNRGFFCLFDSFGRKSHKWNLEFFIFFSWLKMMCATQEMKNEVLFTKCFNVLIFSSMKLIYCWNPTIDICKYMQVHIAVDVKGKGKGLLIYVKYS